MKIAIYDKWLNALGGGEKVAAVAAEALSKAGHEVDLISNFDVDKTNLESKMGVDLTRVNIPVWYERSYSKLTPRTRKYDLLINVSFLDHLPSEAKKSIYYVHFPTPIKTSIFGFIKYETILPLLRSFLIIPEVFRGLEPLDDVYTRGGRWLGRTNIVVFTNAPKQFNLTLRVYAEQFKTNTLDSVTFSSPNSQVKLIDKYVDHHFNVLVYKLFVKSDTASPVLRISVVEDLKINALGLVSLTVRDFRFAIWNFIKRFMPRYEMALYGSSSYKVAKGLDTYDLFLANSNFTKHWTQKYLGKAAKVLFPPIDVDQFKGRRKKNMILNVGRFFVGGHSKRQDILLTAFKKMIDDGLLDKSWELHFVGGIAGGKEHSDYLDKIRQDARDYSVYFHHFVSFKELRDFYSKAKIYWHATGYGVDPIKEPIKMEHFGITPVEAMAAGAVPVVFAGGGLTETVENGSGYTWKSIGDLIKLTRRLVSDKILLEKVSKRAQLR